MTNKQALKPGKYAVLFRNNWDGEGDTYETFATLGEDLILYEDEFGCELLEYQGDAVLKAWPLDDGSNLLALLDELEAKDRRLSEITAPNMLLPAIDDLDENQLRHVIKSCTENYSLLHSKWEAAEKRNSETTEFLAHIKKCLVRNGEYAPLSHEEIDTLLDIRAGGLINGEG